MYLTNNQYTDSFIILDNLKKYPKPIFNTFVIPPKRQDMFINQKKFTRLGSLMFSVCFLISPPGNILAQNVKKQFTQAETDQIKNTGSGVSGAGKPVVGNGWGGWKTGSAVWYSGPDPHPGWKKMPVTDFYGIGGKQRAAS